LSAARLAGSSSLPNSLLNLDSIATSFTDVGSGLFTFVRLLISVSCARFSGGRTRQNQSDYVHDGRSSADPHFPTRPVDRDKAEAELTLNIKKATSPEETAPKQKHVRSTLSPRSSGS
jgi:hypothetical protein